MPPGPGPLSPPVPCGEEPPVAAGTRRGGSLAPQPTSANRTANDGANRPLRIDDLDKQFHLRNDLTTNRLRPTGGRPQILGWIQQIQPTAPRDAFCPGRQRSAAQLAGPASGFHGPTGLSQASH